MLIEAFEMNGAPRTTIPKEPSISKKLGLMSAFSSFGIGSDHSFCIQCPGRFGAVGPDIREGVNDRSHRAEFGSNFTRTARNKKEAAALWIAFLWYIEFGFSVIIFIGKLVVIMVLNVDIKKFRKMI